MTGRRAAHPVVAELAAYRVLIGMTLVEVARRMLSDHGVTVSDDAIRRWEQGLSDPLLRHLDAYAAVLDSRLSTTSLRRRKPSKATAAQIGGAL